MGWNRKCVVQTSEICTSVRLGQNITFWLHPPTLNPIWHELHVQDCKSVEKYNCLYVHSRICLAELSNYGVNSRLEFRAALNSQHAILAMLDRLVTYIVCICICV